MTLILSDILKYQEAHNIIVVDWEKDASSSYSIASARVPFVARDLERFLLEQLYSVSLLDKTHLVGFGLGAHVAGIAGRWTSQVDVNYGRVQRITGNLYFIHFY